MPAMPAMRRCIEIALLSSFLFFHKRCADPVPTVASIINPIESTDQIAISKLHTDAAIQKVVDWLVAACSSSGSARSFAH